MRLRASRKGRTIRTALIVVEVFSCLLPQSSLGPVFSSNSACGGSPPRKADRQRPLSCHGCCLVPPIFTPSPPSPPTYPPPPPQTPPPPPPPPPSSFSS